MISRVKLNLIPQSPGVYMFLSSGKIIYIGKSKNLRERVKAYFDLADTRESVPKIIEEADDIKWIITQTEEDAIFLEHRLILQHLPKYNVKLKDTRGLKYIRIDVSLEYPSLSMTRILKRDSSLYFGPFNIKDARELFEALKRAFNIRTCTEQKFKMFARYKRPCLDGQISLCPAPCVFKVDRTEYLKKVYLACDFLRGRFTKVLDEIEKKMWEESEKENFEVAAKLRDQLKTLRKILDYKRVIFDDFRNSDYASFEIIGNKISVYFIKIREGRFFGSYGGVFRYGGQDIKDVIIRVFTESSDISECVSDCFTQVEKIGSFSFRPPETPEENEVISFAKKSAIEQILQTGQKEGEKIRMLEELSKFLILKDIPKRIEVYDFSNFGGKKLVGVKVHFEVGKLIPERLRFYNVRQEGYDDFFALRNVLERRLKDGISQKDIPLPDLILIDGGKGHYSVAKSVIKSFGLNIPFACIKKENRNTRDITLIYGGEELKPKGKLLEFILKIRDAAHNRAKRFAVEQSTKVFRQKI